MRVPFTEEERKREGASGTETKRRSSCLYCMRVEFTPSQQRRAPSGRSRKLGGDRHSAGQKEREREGAGEREKDKRFNGGMSAVFVERAVASYCVRYFV